VLIKIFSPGFFAREDTATPMKFAALSVAINIAGALALFPFLKHVGIALATTAASWVNAWLLGAALSRRGDWRLDARARRNLPRILAVSVVMGGIVLAMNAAFRELFMPEIPFLVRLGVLAVMVLAGAGVYLALSWITGTLSRDVLRRALKRG